MTFYRKTSLPPKPEQTHEPPVWGEASHLKELFEERAAIKQYDGKMTKEDAERAAANEQLWMLKHGEL